MLSVEVTKLKRRLRLAAGILFLLAVVAGGALLASEWTYIQRLRHYPAKPVTDVDWYEPKEKVLPEFPGDFSLDDLRGRKKNRKLLERN